ncbi:MAG: DUF3786 domain-containing protein [Desulfobacteraceae bacterium]|nr:DUF3786 domain-containing protein [Desulfobacteraceae bacterium]
MARIDDYIHAIKIAAESLSTQPPDLLSTQSGFEMTEQSALRVPFLDRVYRIDYPSFGFSDESQADKQIPLQEQVLILHYLQGRHKPGAGKWIAYREIPGASFYFSAFVKRAIDPLKKTFGANVAGLIKAAGVLGGKKSDTGDAGFEFQLFPNIALRVILWAGDEEFPPEANILFQDSICDILSPEDSAWLAGMLVYRLIAISYR